MASLQDVLREQAAIRAEMEDLMHRMQDNERLINHLSGGRQPSNQGPSASAPGGRGGAGYGGGRPQAAPQGALQQAFAHRAPPSASQVAAARKKRPTMADLQSRRDDMHAALNAAPEIDHWAEPGDKPSSAAINQTEKALKECFEKTRDFQKNPDNPVQALQMLFNRLDPNHSGKLDRHEFIGMSKVIGFQGDDKVMNSLFNRYDYDRSNTIDTAEFGKMLFKADGQSKAMSTIGRIRECLALRAGGYATLKAMAMQFRIGDRDRSGQLSQEEFSVCLDVLLNAFKLNLSPAEKNNLFNFFDVDKSGGVSYDEFVRECRGPMNEMREAFVKQAFDILDKDGSGVVDARDLADTYDLSQNPQVRSGKVSKQDALSKFMDAMGGRNGQITWEHFLDHYQWISSNIDSDDYFELMMRNAWHITGGQGWCENTSDLRVLVIHSNGSQEVVELQHDMGLPHDPNAKYQEIVRRLQKQGVRDIKKVDLQGGV